MVVVSGYYIIMLKMKPQAKPNKYLETTHLVF